MNSRRSGKQYSRGYVCLACLVREGRVRPVSNSSRYLLCAEHAQQFRQWKKRNARFLAEADREGLAVTVCGT